jgi:hypothetical protein
MPQTNPAVSLLRYSPALLLVVIAIADAGRFADPDLWGHITFGQSVLSTWHLTRVDPYSYSAAGHVWNDHEWLTEVLMAAVYNILGVIGLKLMKCLCTAATILLIAMGEAETGASETVQFCVLMIAAVALGAQMQFRPQLFTFIFFAATLWILASDNYGRRTPLWLIAVMMVPWVNVHGGFFIGLITLVLYMGIATLRDLYEKRGWNHGLRLLAVTIATIAATLATPYGLDNWYAVTHTLHNPLTRGLIQEREPLLFVMRLNAVSGHSGLPLYFTLNYETPQSVDNRSDLYKLGGVH